VSTAPAALASGPAALVAEDRRQRGKADRVARGILRVGPENDRGTAEVHNIFSSSIALSATRCLLSYIVFPVLAPWLGAFGVIGPIIGLPVGLAALVFDVRAMRRFFRADHRWRWVAAALYLTVMVMVSILVVRDIIKLS
jgi:anti-sigma factor RsiW